MRIIYKYEIRVGQPTRIKDIGSPLLVSMQGESMYVWVEHGITPDTRLSKGMEIKELRTLTFHVFGTGHNIPDDELEYVGSVQHKGFVWHTYMEVS